MFSALRVTFLTLILTLSLGSYNYIYSQENEVADDSVLVDDAKEIVDVETVNHDDPIEAIFHHVTDANEIQVWGDIVFPLPVIVRKADGSWSTGISSQYVDGKDGLVLSHGHIVNVETHSKDGLMDFSITKNVFMMILSVIVLSYLFLGVKNAYTKRGVTSAPKGFQSLIEPVFIFLRDDFIEPNLGKYTDKFSPYIYSVFFFILINNLFGLIPFFPFGANLSGNIAFTMTLAVLTLIITNVSGSKSYWSHIIAMPGVPKALWLLLTPLELLGILTKPFALMIRLFANITAGHFIVLSLTSLIFILGSNGASIGGAIGGTAVAVPFVLFMNALELLVAFLQAYIFALLSAIFIGLAVVEEH
ncbi:MAG: F0F1 ATP synthase subunit A [Chitinophagales bacterium]|nr:F0F1 ATP synthase subunit A [Chitinophagales bacterium]